MSVQGTVAELSAKYTALLAQLAEFLVVAAVVYGLGRLIVWTAIRWTLTRSGVEPTLERAIGKLVGVGIVIGAIVIGAWTAGFVAFLGGSAMIFAAVTLAVGFAAQDVLSNFVAGVFIVQDPNFNIDDWIEWDTNAGFIEDIGFRVTRVRTFDNETITVPNTELATKPVTNRMSNPTLRISYAVGIGYADDIDEATRLLLAVADEHDDILEEPEPSVRVTDLGDTVIMLQSRFWIDDPDREEFSMTRSEYIQLVTERFEAAGIDLSTSSQHDLSGDLTLHPGDEGWQTHA